ncbi:amidohydrolase family protein [Flagellimonas sp. S174]|uniref:amidohydrolase family protein n=1 Tax=Flagellimonas sp. S174 TaxID=3410790 RepID=UPI003BF543F7
MIKIYFAILLLLICISCSESGKEPTYDLAIQNVSIYNPKKKNVAKNQTILINADTIALISNASKTFKAKTTITKKGNLVTPGFIDTHMHLTQIFGDGSWIAPDSIEDEENFKRILGELYLRHGVTTIFDMGSPEKWLDVTLKWQKSPSAKFPNIYMTGGALKSDEAYEPNMNHSEVLNPAHAKIKIQQYDSLGIQHIKLYSSLNPPELKAVVSKAKELGLNVYGHIDRNNISLSDAMGMGVYNFEHFFTVAESVFNLKDYETQFSERFGFDGIRSIDEYSARLLFFFVFIKESPDLDKKMNELVDELANNKATVSTTIHVLGAVAGKTDFFSSFQTFPLRNRPYFPSFLGVQQQSIAEAFDTMMAFLLKMHQRGIEIRMGTDTQLGGKAFLSEMLLMKNAGFEVPDILTIATLNGAKAMAIDHQYGSIEGGKKADLIIFEENPFDDFSNILGGKTIIKGGETLVFKPSIANTFYKIIVDQSLEEALEWFTNTKKSDRYLKVKKSEFNEVARRLLMHDEVSKGIALLREIEKLFPNSKAYNDKVESQLNTTGYYYLQTGKIEKALEVFKYIVELYPESWNAYDSLGEAYLANNQKKVAIENYQKSVRLNPENSNGLKVLQELQSH